MVVGIGNGKIQLLDKQTHGQVVRMPQLIARRQILHSSKLKDFANDNFKFDEYSRKLFKSVENTVGKGEIALYEQFLLFIRSSKTGRIMGSPMTGGWVGGVQFFVRSISPKLFYLGL